MAASMKPRLDIRLEFMFHKEQLTVLTKQVWSVIFSHEFDNKKEHNFSKLLNTLFFSSDIMQLSKVSKLRNK